MKQLKTYNFEQVDLSTTEPIINIVTINECVAIETINEILPACEKLVNKGDIDWLLKIKAKQVNLSNIREKIITSGLVHLRMLVKKQHYLLEKIYYQ